MSKRSQQLTRHTDGIPPECLMTGSYFDRKPVFLISSNDYPGAGASTLARAILEQTAQLGYPAEHINVGDLVRQEIGATNEPELNAKLGDIGIPSEWDINIYSNLPQDRTVIVDGLLATVAGPKLIKGDRPLTSIDLITDLLTSAKRMAHGDQLDLEKILTPEGAAELIGYMALIGARVKHNQAMRRNMLAVPNDSDRTSDIKPIKFNTSEMSLSEISAYFNANPDLRRFDKYVPEWEIRAIEKTLATLKFIKTISRKKIHENDQKHLDYHIDSIEYNLDRLQTIVDPNGIDLIRKQIRRSLADCWFGLMMKQIPRFFEDTNGVVSLDDKSHSWTPEYYKIAEAWPILSNRLSGKTVLDPFGGAGTLINLLSARGIISNALVSDLSYKGGPSVDGSHTYEAELNAMMAHVLFDDLPSWYKPDLSNIERRQADVHDLQLPDNAVDFVVTDPPYGKNHGSGGVGFTIGCLPELLRVAKDGAVLMVPIDWPVEIAAAGYHVKKLTRDVSRGKSGFPVCYILVKHKKTK